MEPKQVAPGLMLARCILPTLEVATGVSVMNLSGASRKLKADTCLGVAVPVKVISPRGTNEASSQALKMDGSACLRDGAPDPSGESRRRSDGTSGQNDGRPLQLTGLAAIMTGLPVQVAGHAAQVTGRPRATTTLQGLVTATG